MNSESKKDKEPRLENTRGYEKADMDHYGRGEQRRGPIRYAQPSKDNELENDRGENRWGNAESEDYPHYGYDEAGAKEDIQSKR